MFRQIEQRRYLIPFRSRLLPQIITDVLVIGTGVAGLSAAMSVDDNAEVIVVSKSKLQKSNTAWAQGGVAAVMSDEDGVEIHVGDTLKAGAGLCDLDAVNRIVEGGPAAMEWLMKLGMPFDQDDNGKLRLGREGAHSVPRILHAKGDKTGNLMAKTMINAASARDNIRLFDQCFVLDLITEAGPGTKCLGAITHHPKYGLQMIWAKATILASGGCGQVYRETTNPSVATGDGIAMAMRAGAEIADMEFVQFHPTALYIAGAERMLITEAVRGEGAYLINRGGTRFMKDVHELAELAPRDVVSRAIIEQLSASPGARVHLDARHLGGEYFAKRFPFITKKLEQFGIDPGKDTIPIRPAAHYTIGGVWVDECGRTNLEGLYACGEVSCTGLHGANRLASNSLLEGLVNGRLCGETCMEMVENGMAVPVKVISDVPLSDRSELDLSDVKSSLRSIMWRQVGIERDGERLEEVAGMFAFWSRYTLDKIFDDQTGWEVQNQLLLGYLITQAAAYRTESRGTHYRVDHPQCSDPWQKHVLWKMDESEPRHVVVTSQQEAQLFDQATEA